jgi:hypothetical protein
METKAASNFGTQECMQVFIESACYHCPVLTKTGMHQQIWSKIPPDIKFHEICSFVLKLFLACSLTELF